jgi:mono/diheme cytochrome c family protein
VKQDGKEVMPGFKDSGLTPEQADALVKYTRTFKK